MARLATPSGSPQVRSEGCSVPHGARRALSDHYRPPRKAPHCLMGTRRLGPPEMPSMQGGVPAAHGVRFASRRRRFNQSGHRKSQKAMGDMSLRNSAGQNSHHVCDRPALVHRNRPDQCVIG
jgi:hypothetical protein